MRSLPIHLLALAGLSLCGSHFAASGPDAPATPEAPWGAAKVTSVEVVPDEIVLDRRHASIQLLLLANTDEGAIVDATRSAVLVGPSPLVEIDERGIVRPRENGEGVLRFKVDGVPVEVPLRVANQELDFIPDYLQDVMPILSRAGCNAGGCHGSQDGQNGFQLSLRGYDPAADHAALTDELSARRFDRVDPDASLFLLKPTAAVPHEGGRLIDPASSDYEVLRAWVAAGAPFDQAAPRLESIALSPEDPTVPVPGLEQQVRVLASYSDGSTRDVTTHAFVETNDIEITSIDERGLVTALRRGEAAVLARYEGRYAATRVVVMGDRAGFQWPAGEPETHPVDALVNEKLRRVRVLPSQLCSDDEFLRRLRLDLTGTLPTLQEVRTFRMDTRPSELKRTEWIDRLIGSPEFVAYWTNKWCDLLQVTPEALGDEGADAMRTWIHGRLASNRPYDEFVRDLVASSGSTEETPASGFHRIQREPDLAMEATTQLFMGVRFNCNKCHDHPFEKWTQDQHWQLAAYYGGVNRTGVEGMQDEVVSDDGTAEVLYPDGVRVASPSFPFELPARPKPTDDPTLRAELADWLTAEENPYFATSFVNRVWSYLLGTGLIEPVDDIRAGNPPSNPALLEHLTDEFIAGGFDFRALLRTILTSRAYQRSLETNDWNDDDTVNFSHASARRLPAEVLFDAVHQATGATPSLRGVRPGTRAIDIDDRRLDTPDGFLSLFGRPPRESPCECERVENVSLGQALSLLNGETIAQAIQAPGNAIADLVAYESSDEDVVDELFERFLARPATPDERGTFVGALDVTDPRNLQALTPELGESYRTARVAWEEASRAAARWEAVTLQPASASTGGATLAPLADGSVLLQGDNPDQDTLQLVFASDAELVTGLRLEVLSDPSLPSNGPGRAENGNFVLQDLDVTAVPLGDPSAARTLAFSHASASFSQNGYPVTAVIDDDPGSGWAVSARFGERHVAVFELAEDLMTPGGFVLVVRMQQDYGSRHTIGRLRFGVTREARPLRASTLPEAVLDALALDAEARSHEDERMLHERFLATREDLSDAIRLAAAHDVAWALANSSAFLFNR